ncbi:MULTISPECIES: amidohydrolase family protein [unclassified Phenylobacterium]|uniref:amidohydrolase family protein n=1 Tax=unclassified Phenylobacterium TaxID=2640670 RepID=UPI000B30A8E2|nr:MULTISPECIES: amidohydrolase family protein [unclassified Phenylobacterium]
MRNGEASNALSRRIAGAVRMLAVGLSACSALAAAQGAQAAERCVFSDSHFHLTNYIQEGPTAGQALKVMGDKLCRSTLFGIPLQQQWAYHISGDIAPAYYLESDAPLYYYSFTDAAIAAAYNALPPADRARFDPMITGFNPADMYAADHVRRVLTTYPGVFSGIGEFSIHKEFVSPKIAGGPAGLTDPALARLLDFSGEVGLVAILHNDLVMPFTKDDKVRPYFEQLRALLARHPRTTIIWAHMGLGRIVTPVKSHAALIEEMINDPALKHVYFDISWDEVAKYVVASEEATQITADLINRHPDRFLFGSDVVAPTTTEKYMSVYEMYQPLWAKLTPTAREKILKGNYARIFDTARVRVRAWEKANVGAAAR